MVATPRVRRSPGFQLSTTGHRAGGTNRWSWLRPEGGNLRKILSTLAIAAAAPVLMAGHAAAETANPFKCEPGEKYVMNVMDLQVGFLLL